MALQAPSGRCYVRSRRMRWSRCPQVNHPTSIPTGPPIRPSIPSGSCYVASSSSTKTRLSTCLSVTTRHAIINHSKVLVQDPHSLRRTSHCAGGLSTCYTRLHVCRQGLCRHQVRELQLSSTHPQEARFGQAVCGNRIHKPDTT